MSDIVHQRMSCLSIHLYSTNWAELKSWHHCWNGDGDTREVSVTPNKKEDGVFFLLNQIMDIVACSATLLYNNSLISTFSDSSALKLANSFVYFGTPSLLIKDSSVSCGPTPILVKMILETPLYISLSKSLISTSTKSAVLTLSQPSTCLKYL